MEKSETGREVLAQLYFFEERWLSVPRDHWKDLLDRARKCFCWREFLGACQEEPSNELLDAVAFAIWVHAVQCGHFTFIHPEEKITDQSLASGNVEGFSYLTPIPLFLAAFPSCMGGSFPMIVFLDNLTCPSVPFPLRTHGMVPVLHWRTTRSGC